MRRHGSQIVFFTIFWISVPPISVFSQTAHKGIQLPHASGSYGVARVGYDWVDRARRETYAKDSTARREIMVYVWYPTVRGSGLGVRSEYLPHADAIAKTLNDVPGKIEEFWGESWASVFSGTVLGDTYEKAPISPGIERFPVLIFAPGFATPSTSYTTLIEEVVSQGFIVASTCLDADGGAAEGAASLPTQPFMWIDVYHEPATEAQLAVHKITQKEWENYHRARLKATEERMHNCPDDCYRLSIRVPGTDHYSFSDSPLLSAASKKDFDAAVQALQPLEAYTIAFFDKYLKHLDVPLLNRPNFTASGITLEHTGEYSEGSRGLKR
jgi:hypothetical protein